MRLRAPSTCVRIPLAGIFIDQVKEGEVIERIKSFVLSGERHQIITANPLMIMAAEKDPALRAAFDAADLVIADSAGVQWAARLKGGRLTKISGIDLMVKLCACAAQRGWRVFFLGAAPGVAQAAARVLSERLPSLTVAGVHHGYFTHDGNSLNRHPGEGRPVASLPAPGAAVPLIRDPVSQDYSEEDIIHQIAQAQPDLLFVGLSTPFQDGWIHKNLERLGAKVVMGVGGSFDVISGRLRRAPAWMRAAGLEWLFRLLQEPRRAARMLRLPLFPFKVLLRW